MNKNTTITQYESKSSFERALAMFSSGFYAPLHKRYPVYSNEAIPVSTKKLLISHSTCACTEGEHIYIDTDCGADLISLARKTIQEKRAKEGYPEIYFADPQDDYTTIIAHEYTHILMEHVKRGKRFVKKYGYKNFDTFQLACDIEANRGWGVYKRSSVYQIGVTEDSFPETKGVKGLMNIYQALLAAHKDDIDNEVSQAGSGQPTTSQEAQEGGSSSKGDSSTNSQKNSLTEAQKEAIRNSASDYEDMKRKIEQYNDDDENAEDIDDDLDVPNGRGGDNMKYGSADPEDILRATYNQAMARQMETALSRLKNIISGGNLIREKVKTYSRPSRRDGEGGLMRKGTKIAKVKAPKVLIGMDSSGSMSNVTMKQVVDSIGTVIDRLGQANNKGSYICKHECEVRNVQPLKNWKAVVSGYYAIGGNDFDNLLRKALDLGVDVVLNIGDGCDTIRDTDLIKRANERGLKWYDVIISGTVDGEMLQKNYYDTRPTDSIYHLERLPIKVI